MGRIGCLQTIGGGLCWLGLLVGLVPFFLMLGWIVALLGILVVWMTPMKTGERIILVFLPIALLVGWSWYLFAYVIH